MQPTSSGVDPPLFGPLGLHLLMLDDPFRFLLLLLRAEVGDYFAVVENKMFDV